MHVLVNYHTRNLARRVRDIGPHLAGLLSVVPETYSYTLSEMQALGIPVVATRLGSFPERIRDGQDGWLIEPTAEALVERIADIAAHPESLEVARAALAERTPVAIDDMLAQYQPLFTDTEAPALPAPSENPGLTGAQDASFQDLELRGRQALKASQQQVVALKATIEKRTQWALSEQQQRESWVASLKQELADLDGQLQQAIQQLESLQADLDKRNRHITG